MTLLPKLTKKAITAKDGSGKDVEGQLVLLKSPEADDLYETIDNKIVLVKSVDIVLLSKVVALGALGIITQELEDFDFIDLSEKPLSANLLVVSEEDFKVLEGSDKKNVKINGENKSIIIL